MFEVSALNGLVDEIEGLKDENEHFGCWFGEIMYDFDWTDMAWEINDIAEKAAVKIRKKW